MFSSSDEGRDAPLRGGQSVPVNIVPTDHGEGVARASPAEAQGPTTGQQFTMPDGPVVRTSDLGLSETQFDRLLTIIQGCLGSNNSHPQQATPPVVTPVQAEPALSRNRQRPIQQRLGDQPHHEDLRNLLD